MPYKRPRDRFRDLKREVYEEDGKKVPVSAGFASFCTAVGKKMGGVDKNRVIDFYSAFVEQVMSDLKKQKICYLRGFGSFYLLKWRGRCFRIKPMKKDGQRELMTGYWGDRLVVRFEPNKRVKSYFQAISRSIEVELAEASGEDPEIVAPNRDELKPVSRGSGTFLTKEAFDAVNGQELYDSSYPLKKKNV